MLVRPEISLEGRNIIRCTVETSSGPVSPGSLRRFDAQLAHFCMLAGRCSFQAKGIQLSGFDPGVKHRTTLMIGWFSLGAAQATRYCVQDDRRLLLVSPSSTFPGVADIR